MAQEKEERLRALTTTIILMLAVAATASERKTESVLLSSYIRFGMTQTIEQRVKAIGKDSSAITASQLTTVISQWKQEQLIDIRTKLENAFAQSAANEFADFVAEYTEAESKNNSVYLSNLADRITGGKPIADYNQLREYISERNIKDFSASCVKLMGDIEAWTELTQEDKPVPPLHIWLSRDEQAKKAISKPSSTDRLRNAEAVSDIDTAVLEENSESLLSQYEATKDKRNKAKLARAKAGMAQLAKERKSYEDAYAKKTLAKATADAEAMKRQARRIADAEKDAIKQYQNSWGMKVKRLIGATVGATSSAFFGGIGARAGAEAAKAIF